MYTYLDPVDDGLPMRTSGAWALEKLDYLSRYISVFENSMHKKWEIRNYIDLLAGPGKNRIRESNRIYLGSPLVALTTKYPFTGYYFVEYETDNAEALIERCRASNLRDCVHTYVGDCNEQVDRIVTELTQTDGHSLNLAFLDPEGLELHWATVAKLASVRRMDLIINYPQGGLNRYMRQAFSSTDETKVDRFFGSKDWRCVYKEYQQSHHFSIHNRLIDLYRSRLQALGYQEIRRDDEVGTEPLMRNTKRKAPLYRLLFASKHPLGTTFWHEIMQRDIYGQRRLLD